MKIVISSGKETADFLIGSLLAKKHTLIVINEDQNFCTHISEKYDIPIFYGDPTKIYVMEDAEVNDADIFIALKDKDADNLIMCQLAKKMFHIRKAVSIVSNPKNVAIFKKLGVNTAISATFTISKMIEQSSTIENLISTLSLEANKIVISEVLVENKSRIVNQSLKDISFPDNTTICCIIRGEKMIIPQGNTTIYAHDKLLILSAFDHQEEIIRSLCNEK
ncbi:MAG: TrkA family potassium uptake protein [Erysipelotrichia bacterium]|nr:TrkA family potassium uptake protein [Erysipelotrichia bacterium]NCC55546.1 TrkA family potassium uptake protein [Erysipelotrichia bacterium]